MYIEIITVVLLTLLNGVLAMSELAIVSSRQPRLRVLADKGSRGALIAMELAEHPGRFLSTVQIGITLVGVLSGAFSGATLGSRLTGWLIEQGVSPTFADTFGVGIVVVLITYLSLIIGELVPKQIALRDPETIACNVAPVMKLLSKVAAPLVWLLDISGRAVLRLLGQTGETGDNVSEEEVKSILAEAKVAGILEHEESAMIAGVMRLADRTARGLMTSRVDVELIDLGDSIATIEEQLSTTRWSRLPARDAETSVITGIIQVSDYFKAKSCNSEVHVNTLVREVPVILDTTDALDVVQAIRRTPLHMVLVYDEYGHFEGVISAGDVMEAILGVMQEELVDEQAIVRRADGSYLVSGWMPIDEFSAFLQFPLEEQKEYSTVAGLVLEELRYLPDVGTTFTKNGWKFEIVDMDGRRIDKLLLMAE